MTRVEDLPREPAPQALGAVARRYGDIDNAEDAVQEALLAAPTHWPAEGVPRQSTGPADHGASRRMVSRLSAE